MGQYPQITQIVKAQERIVQSSETRVQRWNEEMRTAKDAKSARAGDGEKPQMDIDRADGRSEVSEARTADPELSADYADERGLG